MKGVEEAIARLEEEKKDLQARIKTIEDRIDGMRAAIRIHQGGGAFDDTQARKRIRRGNLKEIVIDLLTESADKGLAAEECVAFAKRDKGVTLVQGSVSSLLSRLKSDEIVFFDGQRYRLKQFAGPKRAA